MTHRINLSSNDPEWKAKLAERLREITQAEVKQTSPRENSSIETDQPSAPILIHLDASGWQDINDLNAALKHALGSVEGHGNSPDAWVDSMLHGGMNKIAPPYTIRITGTASCSASLRSAINDLAATIRAARAWKREHTGIDTDVDFAIEP